MSSAESGARLRPGPAVEVHAGEEVCHTCSFAAEGAFAQQRAGGEVVDHGLDGAGNVVRLPSPSRRAQSVTSTQTMFGCDEMRDRLDPLDARARAGRRGDRRAHRSEPPFTWRTVPVTKVERGESRNTQAPAISCGRPRRPNSVRAPDGETSARASPPRARPCRSARRDGVDMDAVRRDLARERLRHRDDSSFAAA